MTDAEELAYLKSLQVGERVIETTKGSERYGKQGTIYISANPGLTFGSKCVKWEDGLGTGVTHGTRRVSDTP